MKRLFVLASILGFSLVTMAQSPIGKTGKQFNCGLGLSGTGVPVYFGFDFGVHPDITAGFEMSYRSYNDSWYDEKKRDSFTAHHNIITIAGTMNYHFNTVLEIPRNWDFYAGLNIGYSVWTSPSDYGGNSTSGLGLGLQAGGRYYFTKKIGANLEIGGTLSGAGGKAGVSFIL